MICDGKIIEKALPGVGLDVKLLKKHLKKIGRDESEIMALTYSKNGFGKAIDKK